jgi:L-fuculose-phosphate aldolase
MKNKYPSIYEAREQIIEIGKRMYMKGLVVANDGNISCKLSDDVILATPTGVSKGYMTSEMMVRLGLDGTVMDNNGYAPSSEVKMHLRVYKENPEVVAVCHAHPPVATSFSIAGIPLDRAILNEGVVAIGTVPIAKYATPGTYEVPDSIAPYCVDYNALLLANHGALTWGSDIMEAYFRMETLEYYATLLMYTGNIIGKSNELSCEQVSRLVDIREKLGIKSGGIPPCPLLATNTVDVLPGCSECAAQAENNIKDIIERVVADVLDRND